MGYLNGITVLSFFALFVAFATAGNVVHTTNNEDGSQSFHKETSLEELQKIDGIVATGLPVFTGGFFVPTAHGQVLVKRSDESSQDEVGKSKLNPRYYFELPRFIPKGYEGLSASYFNLGSNFYPIATTKPLSPSTNPDHMEPSSTFRVSRVFSGQRNHRQERFQKPPMIMPPPPPPPRPRPRPFSYMQFHSSNEIAHSGFEPHHHNGGGGQRFPLIRSPVVERATAFDESLPPHMRNNFYKNPHIASVLAEASLPRPGETLVTEWDTAKIQKGRIYSLLTGAGLL